MKKTNYTDEHSLNSEFCSNDDGSPLSASSGLTTRSGSFGGLLALPTVLNGIVSRLSSRGTAQTPSSNPSPLTYMHDNRDSLSVSWTECTGPGRSCDAGSSSRKSELEKLTTQESVRFMPTFRKDTRKRSPIAQDDDNDDNDHDDQRDEDSLQPNKKKCSGNSSTKQLSGLAASIPVTESVLSRGLKRPALCDDSRSIELTEDQSCQASVKKICQHSPSVSPKPKPAGYGVKNVIEASYISSERWKQRLNAKTSCTSSNVSSRQDSVMLDESQEVTSSQGSWCSSKFGRLSRTGNKANLEDNNVKARVCSQSSMGYNSPIIASKPGTLFERLLDTERISTPVGNSLLARDGGSKNRLTVLNMPITLNNSVLGETPQQKATFTIDDLEKDRSLLMARAEWLLGKFGDDGDAVDDSLTKQRDTLKSSATTSISIDIKTSTSSASETQNGTSDNAASVVGSSLHSSFLFSGSTVQQPIVSTSVINEPSCSISETKQVFLGMNSAQTSSALSSQVVEIGEGAGLSIRESDNGDDISISDNKPFSSINTPVSSTTGVSGSLASSAGGHELKTVPNYSLTNNSTCKTTMPYASTP